MNMLPDAVLRDVLGYARDVCLNVGHVRTGIGDMDRCSRCGEPVTDRTMKKSIETSYRGRLAELYESICATIPEGEADVFRLQRWADDIGRWLDRE